MSAVAHFFAVHPEIEFIRLLQVNYGNVIRARIVPKIRFIAMSETRGDSQQIATVGPISAVFLSDGAMRWDIVNPGDDDHWIPDWSTRRTFPAEPGTAVVMCFIRETARKDDPFACCPRDVLSRVTKKAKEDGLEFLVGHEIEFTLMLKTNLTAGIANGGGNWTTTGLRHEGFAVVQESVHHLEVAGIRVWNFTSEGGPGQYEIALGPLDPMAAADAVVSANETIKTVASKKGFHATLHLYPFEGADPVGLHVHVSVNNPEKNGDLFLASVLKHAKALLAFLLGGLYSYHPTRSAMLGAGDISWSTYKFAAVHRLNPGRFEIRWPDSLSNPHLQLSAILATGLAGIWNGLRLDMKPSDGNGIGTPLSTEQKDELGVKHRVPDTLDERVQALVEDQSVFNDLLGRPCVQSYVDYRKATAVTPVADTAARRAKEVNDI